MARKPTQKAQLIALAEKWEPEIRIAFVKSVNDIRGRLQLNILIARIEAGDVEGALRVLNLDPEALQPFAEAVRSAYVAGGVAETATLPMVRMPDGMKLEFRFNARSPRAESWLERFSSNKITRIIEDQKESVREVLVQGLTRGDNPRTTALDIIGRVTNGRREGGIIGLTKQQKDFVFNARAELSSPNTAEAFLERTRRDRRFDRAIMKAVREGKSLDPASIDKIVGKYSDSLLQLRGETVARTEALAALNASHMEAYEQAAERGEVSPENVVKVWVATNDKRTRDIHREMDGEEVPINQPYSNGLMHPCDPAGPAEEVINCRCTQFIRIDFLAGLT